MFKFSFVEYIFICYKFLEKKKNDIKIRKINKLIIINKN